MYPHFQFAAGHPQCSFIITLIDEQSQPFLCKAVDQRKGELGCPQHRKRGQYLTTKLHLKHLNYITILNINFKSLMTNFNRYIYKQQQITLDIKFELTVVTQGCQLVRYKRFGTHYCHCCDFH